MDSVSHKIAVLQHASRGLSAIAELTYVYRIRNLEIQSTPQPISSCLMSVFWQPWAVLKWQRPLAAGWVQWTRSVRTARWVVARTASWYDVMTRRRRGTW